MMTPSPYSMGGFAAMTHEGLDRFRIRQSAEETSTVDGIV
jgi:hypothetical protein